jgi:hypothetical protein
MHTVLSQTLFNVDIHSSPSRFVLASVEQTS